MRLRDIIESITNAANGSQLFSEIKLLKTEDDIERMFNDAKYRTLYMVVTGAEIVSDDDNFSISLTIADKIVEGDDDSYIASVQDGIAGLRLINDRVNYAASYMGAGDGGVTFSEVEIVSGKYQNDTLVVIDTVMTYSYDVLHNIRIADD